MMVNCWKDPVLTEHDTYLFYNADRVGIFLGAEFPDLMIIGDESSCEIYLGCGMELVSTGQDTQGRDRFAVKMKNNSEASDSHNTECSRP